MTDNLLTYIQREGKLNFEELSKLDTTRIDNLTRNWKSISPIWSEFVDFKNGLTGFAPGVVFDKPNSVLRECEGSPGVWIFDFSNGVTLLMFSDGFRKNHYKGTSYELVVKEGQKEESVADSLKLFKDDFVIKFKEKLPEEQKKLEEIFKKVEEKAAQKSIIGRFFR